MQTFRCTSLQTGLTYSMPKLTPKHMPTRTRTRKQVRDRDRMHLLQLLFFKLDRYLLTIRAPPQLTCPLISIFYISKSPNSSPHLIRTFPPPAQPGNNPNTSIPPQIRLQMNPRVFIQPLSPHQPPQNIQPHNHTQFNIQQGPPTAPGQPMPQGQPIPPGQPINFANIFGGMLQAAGGQPGTQPQNAQQVNLLSTPSPLLLLKRVQVTNQHFSPSNRTNSTTCSNKFWEH